MTTARRETPPPMAAETERERFAAYLILLEYGGVALALAEAVRSVWKLIVAAHGESFPLPIAQPLDDHFTFVWSKKDDDRYFELEFSTVERADWFYKNHGTGEVDGSEEEEEMSTVIKRLEVLL